MIQGIEIDGFSVIGYDKDNDVFVSYGVRETLECAITSCIRPQKLNTWQTVLASMMIGER